MIELQTKSWSGSIVPYDRNVEMLGAVNRENVTCWLDALLFAMFAKLEPFQCMLRTESGVCTNRDHLAALLRLWVNMLRSGKLIPADIVCIMT